MARPKSKDKRKNRFLISMNDAEYAHLKIKKGTMNVSFAEFIREAALKIRINHFPLEMGEFIREINKIGVNINTLTKYALTQGGITLAEEDRLLFKTLLEKVTEINNKIIALNKKFD